MSWAKLDDRFCMHPKVRLASVASRGLWVTALSWSASMETDGFIPEHMIQPLCDPVTSGGPLADELVACGLWQRGNGGYQFHDYLDHNPSREMVLARRQAGAARLHAYRERKRESNALPPRECNASETLTPTRPDPARKEEEQDPSRLGRGSGGKRRADRAAPLPDDFPLTETRRKFAEAGGVPDPGLEFAQFKDHHRSKGSLMYDWEAAWKTWCRNAIKYAAQRQQRR